MPPTLQVCEASIRGPHVLSLVLLHDGARMAYVFARSRSSGRCKVACFFSETRSSSAEDLACDRVGPTFFSFLPDNPIHNPHCTVAHEHVANKKTREAITIFRKALLAVHSGSGSSSVSSWDLGVTGSLFFFWWPRTYAR